MCPYVVYTHYEAAKIAFLRLECIVVYGGRTGMTETSLDRNWGQTMLISAVLWDYGWSFSIFKGEQT